MTTVTTTDAAEPAELKDFQHWKDSGLAKRGFVRWNDLRGLAPRAFASRAPHPGRATATWWYLLSYEDIQAAYTNPDLFSSAEWQAAVEGSLELIPVGLDPPRHGKFRKILNPLFTAREIGTREAGMRDLCRGLVSKIATGHSCDFMHDFALRFPTGVFLQFMGLPASRLDRYVELVHRIVRTPLDQDLDGKITAAAEEAIFADFAEFLEERRQSPKRDPISQLLAAEIDGQKLKQEELLSTLYILLRGGLDTVVAMLGHMFSHLAGDEALRAKIISEPGAIPGIVEEMMRFYSIAMSARTVTKDTEFAGCSMAKGDRVILPVAAANRDASAFAHPDVFDPTRMPNKHLGFGSGIHFCLGRVLARAEMRIALEEWHKILPNYRLRGADAFKLVLTDATVSVERLDLTW